MKILNRRLLTILIVTLLSLQFCYSLGIKEEEKNVDITYIANEGFLIRVDDKTILIDALFGDKEYSFCDIPDSSQINSMIEAKEDFANVDLVAATHWHIDHFYSPFVYEYLTNSRSTKFVSTKQTMDKILETDNYMDVKAQLIEVSPDSLMFRDTIISGIGIRVFHLSHAPYYFDDPNTGKRINRHRYIHNIGFLFNIDGVKIFHCGDSSPTGISDYEHFRLDKEDIDIAFLHRGFMSNTDNSRIDVLRKYIDPEHIILMHIHHDKNKRFIDVAKELCDEFPSVKVFEKRMETKNYIINKR